MPIETILALVIGAAYLIVVFFWVNRYFNRIEPSILNSLGERLDLKIQRVGRNWQIRDQHTWQQGCLVALLELVTTMFLLIAPFWLLIAVILTIILFFSR